MNDITKAKHFLKARGSDMQHLESFALMLATAESKYRELKMRQVGHKDFPGTWDAKEVELSIDLAVLKYLKKNNRLPADVSSIFHPSLTAKEKLELAKQWANS